MPVSRQRAPHRCRTERELSALARLIDDSSLDLAPPDPPRLVRVTGRRAHPSQAEVALLPLAAGQHPTDLLLGFTAPRGWAAVGVISTAHQHATDRPHASAVPVRLTFLLDRSGCSVTLLTPLEPASAKMGARRELTSHPEGQLADVCHRVLGLATPPPAEHPAEWLTRRWLDRILTEAVARPGRPGTWAEAVALHPLVGPGAPPTPAGLAQLTSGALSNLGWDGLRLLAARGADEQAPLVGPEVAAWMDAGCFARWLLAAELPEHLLLGELGALLPPVVVEAIGSAIRPPPLPSRAPEPPEPPYD
jgi:hypothetical protein